MTTSVSPDLSLAQSIFKSVIWDPMISAGEIWIETEVPLLDFPVVKEADEALIKQVTDRLFTWIVTTIDVDTIALMNPARQSMYASASEALKLIATEQGATSAAFKQAEASAITAQIKFTSFIGS